MENDSNTQGVLKMVRPIMREPLFLAGKSEPATEAVFRKIRIYSDILQINWSVLMEYEGIWIFVGLVWNHMQSKS